MRTVRGPRREHPARLQDDPAGQVDVSRPAGERPRQDPPDSHLPDGTALFGQLEVLAVDAAAGTVQCAACGRWLSGYLRPRALRNYLRLPALLMTRTRRRRV